MQIELSCNPNQNLCNMKVKLEIPKQAMVPSRSLPRSASEIADPPSPFSSNPAHHPVSMPTTPATATWLSTSASFGCMSARYTTGGSPPVTPSKAKPKPVTPAAAAAAYYASLWSPRRLMQRAARAFRTSRSRRVRGSKDAGEERSVTSKFSDASVRGGAAGNDGHGVAAAGVQQEEQHHHHHPEVVPEKIIHELNHHARPPVVTEDECVKTTPAEEKENAAADAAEEVESPKKGAALAPAPELEAAVAAAEDDVADKFVTVVKEAIKKHEAEQQQQQDEKKEAMRRFQGSRVKTAMEARAESEQPRRRDPAPRSNDVIEEARSKLLEKRHSRVRALVGAFETVMDDAKKDAAAAGTPKGTPRHNSRKSV